MIKRTTDHIFTRNNQGTKTRVLVLFLPPFGTEKRKLLSATTISVFNGYLQSVGFIISFRSIHLLKANHRHAIALKMWYLFEEGKKYRNI